MIKKSPSGSLCPYYYMGGEIHPLKYGSYFNNKEKLFAIIDAEQEFILSSSGNKNRRVWIDLYETALDDEVVQKLACHLKAIENKIFKICMVGCSVGNSKRIIKALDNSSFTLTNQIKFFMDAEQSKKWLIGEK